MKSTFKLMLAAFVCVLAFSKNSPAQDEKKTGMAAWPELKAFHEVIAQTFHPSEEGNLKPIRERSAELNQKAEALEQSKAPAEFDKPEIKAAAKELTAKTKALDELVKTKGTDEQVTTLLASTHDTFHKIVGLCNPKGDPHGHEGHGHDHVE